MKRLAKYLGAGIIGLLAIIIGVDTGLHFSRYASIIPRQFFFPPGYFGPDHETLDSIAPNFASTTYDSDGTKYVLWSNEIGCYDESILHRHIDIYLSGDNYTWTFAPYEFSWGRRLEQLLGVDTAKCGVPGFGTTQELLKTTRDIEVIGAPRLIVLVYDLNDVADDVAFKEGRRGSGCSISIIPTLSSLRCLLYYHSVLFNLIVQRVSLLSDDLSPIVRPESLTQQDFQQNEEHIREFKQLADAKHAQFLVVLFPAEGNVSPTVTNAPRSSVFVEKQLPEFLLENNIAFFDPTSQFKKYVGEDDTNLYWRDTHHLTEKGNSLLASLIAERILADGLVAVDDVAQVRARLEKEKQL